MPDHGKNSSENSHIYIFLLQPKNIKSAKEQLSGNSSISCQKLSYYYTLSLKAKVKDTKMGITNDLPELQTKKLEIF